VEIDHMVPLADAWKSGADGWTVERRHTFGNDLEHPQLLAVSQSSNASKGNRSPDAWQPSQRAYWCTYARAWVHTKHIYHLAVTDAEHFWLSDVIHNAC
jgi:hypothetical protein